MYECDWPHGVLDELAVIYVSATGPERDRMASGIEALNSRLTRDPFDIGESRSGGDRLAFIPLLMVRFDVNKTARRIVVTGVARYGA